MRRIPTAALALLSLASLASLDLACGNPSDSIVVIAVEAAPDVTGVVQLRATLSLSDDGSSAMRSFPVVQPTTPLALPTAFSVTLAPAHTGQLDVALDGIGADGQVVANGSASVRIAPGRRADGRIDLRAGASLCGNGRLDPGEQCDDGDRISTGTCDFRCAVLGPGSDGGADATGAGGAGGGAGGADGGAGGAGGAGGSNADAGIEAGPCMVSLLSNGSFDDGDTGWVEVSSSGVSLIFHQSDPQLVAAGVPPESPSYLAWLGGDAFAFTSKLAQQVVIPTNAVTLSVRGFVYITTDEDDLAAYDTANVELVHGPDVLPFTDWSNLDHGAAWVSFDAVIDVTALRGATVTFQVRAVTDDGTVTNFFLDTLSLITACR